MIVLDVPFVFETLGGPQALWRLLTQQNPGAPLNYATVQMWKTRDQISARWVPAVMLAMAQAGYPLTHMLTDDDPFSEAAHAGSGC